MCASYFGGKCAKKECTYKHEFLRCYRYKNCQIKDINSCLYLHISEQELCDLNKEKANPNRSVSIETRDELRRVFGSLYLVRQNMAVMLQLSEKQDARGTAKFAADTDTMVSKICYLYRFFVFSPFLVNAITRGANFPLKKCIPEYYVCPKTTMVVRLRFNLPFSVKYLQFRTFLSFQNLKIHATKYFVAINVSFLLPT